LTRDGTPVRVGVIGAGAFGRRHLEYLLRNPLCAAAGVADPAPAARAFATERGLACYPDAETLLDRASPDGVIIASPNALHVPVGLACAERRVPMLVEKPIAESLDAARALCAAAARTGTPVLVGHHRRHNPILERAREVVQGGLLGRLVAVTALVLLRKPDEYFDVPWRRAPGGGPVLINLIHDVDALRFVAGEIAAVAAFTAGAARGLAVEDTAAVALRFAGGALGTVTLSDAAAGPWSWELSSGENPLYPQQPASCYLFSGTAGSLAVPALELWRYPGAARWDAPLERAVLTVAGADPLERQLEHFRRVILGRESPRVTAEDATSTLEATLAVHAAAAGGGAVALGSGPG
jgi:predicted dehydrogenase